jgi:hypothetical protein
MLTENFNKDGVQILEFNHKNPIDPQLRNLGYEGWSEFKPLAGPNLIWSEKYQKAFELVKVPVPEEIIEKKSIYNSEGKKIFCNPENSTPEDWKEFLLKMNSGEEVEITKDMFDYWMECLPPRKFGNVPFNGKTWRFAFAEGAETLTFFRCDSLGRRYFCQKDIYGPVNYN